MQDIDPKLLDTADAEGMTSDQQQFIARQLMDCSHEVFKLANGLPGLIPPDDSPAPLNGELVTNLERIAELGRLLNERSRQLINNSEN